MTKRRRLVVVIDTNVFVGNFISRSSRSPNRRVIRLWVVDRAFRVAISEGIKKEYLRIFDGVLDFDANRKTR